MFESKIYSERRLRLRKKIRSGIVLILGNNESPMNYSANTYHFRQDSNFLYYFGLDLPGLVGVIDIEDGKDCIYGNNVDIEDIIWMGPQPTINDLAAKVGVLCTHPLKDLSSTLQRAIKQGRKIHFTPPYRADNILTLERLLGIHQSLVQKYSSAELVNAIVSMRSIKEACEIAEIEKACDIGYKMHTTAMMMAKVGETERNIAGTIEGIANGLGLFPSFPIILSQNGETLHNHDHSQVLKEGRLLLCDAGAEAISHYSSDFTRTIPVGGKFTQRQKDIYNIVLAANNKAIEISKPNIPYIQVHLEAAKVIATGLKNLGLMKGDVSEAVANGAHALFYPHGLGHMMGIDVHDMEDLGENNVGYDDEISRSDQFGTAYVRLGRRLQEGFVITVEPGIYFIPALLEKWKSEMINSSFINYDKVAEYIGFGGIRLEDDILITSKGCRILGSKRIPITVEEVEKTVLG
ncbi:MAG: aminopeptidase P family protein [Bacteroidales bacterium]|nr:MAG: aminopeptidase P family protein [Bacteroidales bacterium]